MLSAGFERTRSRAGSAGTRRRARKTQREARHAAWQRRSISSARGPAARDVRLAAGTTVNRVLVAASLALFLASGAAAQTSVPQLSPGAQAERMRLLPDEDRGWLELVEPIILSGERNFFLLLPEQHQRDIFKGEFWKRREKPELTPPLGPGYRYRYEELLKLANDVYDGWRQDAGRMVIAHGEPNELKVVKGCDLTFRHLEIWTYSDAGPGAHGPRRYFFYSASPQAPRKLWRFGDPSGEIFQPGSCRKNFVELWAECAPRQGDPCFSACKDACRIYRTYVEIQARHDTRTGANVEQAQILAPPSVSTEDLSELAARFPGVADSRAKPIAVESAGTRQGSATPEAEHWLTQEEIRDRIVRLEPKYRQWLELAGPLLKWSELTRFLQLPASDKDRFIREFFKRRS
jgi:GWxTD domain-containing protein